MKSKIENALRKALLHEGEMEYALFEWELEENIPFWLEGLNADKDEFVFVVTEKDGDIAMLLITKNEQLFINEKARSKLKELFPKAYPANIETLMPMMVDMLASGVLYVNGVKYSGGKLSNPNQRRQV